MNIYEIAELENQDLYCENCENLISTKEYIVATFLAVLEMVKNKEIVITQNDTFDDIVCEVKE